MLSLTAITFASCSKKEDTVDPGNNDTTGNNGNIELIKKYEIKSGIISFNVINSLTDDVNTYKLYFDEYGAKEAKYEYNSKGVLETVTMQKADGWEYTVSIKNKAGEKRAEQYASGVEAEFSLESWSDKYKTEYKLTALADTIIAGKTCKFYSYITSGIPVRNAGYKGIQLYYKVINTSSSFSFSAGFDATKIEENVAIPLHLYGIYQVV